MLISEKLIAKEDIYCEKGYINYIDTDFFVWIRWLREIRYRNGLPSGNYGKW